MMKPLAISLALIGLLCIGRAARLMDTPGRPVAIVGWCLVAGLCFWIANGVVA